jgi:hypothetical protein
VKREFVDIDGGDRVENILMCSLWIVPLQLGIYLDGECSAAGRGIEYFRKFVFCWCVENPFRDCISDRWWGVVLAEFLPFAFRDEFFEYVTEEIFVYPGDFTLFDVFCERLNILQCFLIRFVGSFYNDVCLCLGKHGTT